MATLTYMLATHAPKIRQKAKAAEKKGCTTYSSLPLPVYGLQVIAVIVGGAAACRP